MATAERNGCRRPSKTVNPRAVSSRAMIMMIDDDDADADDDFDDGDDDDDDDVLTSTHLSEI